MLSWRPQRPRRLGAHRQAGLRDAEGIVDELLAQGAPTITMDSSEEDIVREPQGRNGLQDARSRRATGSSREAVREHRGRAPCTHRCRAGLEGAQVPQARHPRRADPGGAQSSVPGGAARTSVKGTDGVDEGGRGRDRQGTRPQEDRGRQASARRRATDEIRHITTEVGRLDADARLGAVHAWPDEDPHALDAGHRQEQQRIDDLSTRAGASLHAPLQLPAVSVGEIGFMRGPKRRDIGHGALAQRALDAVIRRSRTSRTRCGWSPRRSSRTAPRRWPALRLHAVADGRGRADQGARRGHRDGPRQGGRRLRHPHRHPGRGGPPRRHGLQGRRHPRASPPSRWTSRSPASRRRSCGTPSSRQSRQGSSSSTGWPRRSRKRRGASWLLTRLGSRRSRINADYIGMVIGKGGETIRALEADYDVQIDIGEDGTILVYATGKKKSDACYLGDRRDDQGARGRRHVHGPGREDDRVRRVRRVEEGHRRPAPRLERRSRAGSRTSRTSWHEETSWMSSCKRWTRSGAGSASSSLPSTRTAHWCSPEVLIERAKDAPAREPRPPRDDRGGRGGRSGGRRRD